LYSPTHVSAKAKTKSCDSSANYVQLDQEELARRQESLGILKKVQALNASRDVRVLDVGCGAGSFLKTLSKEGYKRIEGIEFSKFAAERAAKETGATVHHGALHEADLPDNTYDIVNATEVIEHVRDPLKFFEKVRKILVPGGLFVYSTGNQRGNYARFLGPQWPYLIPEGHLFYFNPQTIQAYFHKVGLEPVRGDKALECKLKDAEAQIAHAQVTYVGLNESGLKGHIFRTVARLEMPWAKHLVSSVVGKGKLPMARKPL
jgi:2-polyprenyl-3-methyl-5-hydroxy-6-metoxy-1,4-benzoquinol methylase